jgi:hypothetical protein
MSTPRAVKYEYGLLLGGHPSEYSGCCICNGKQFDLMNDLENAMRSMMKHAVYEKSGVEINSRNLEPATLPTWKLGTHSLLAAIAALAKV